VSAYHFGQLLGVAAVVVITIFVVRRARSTAWAVTAVVIGATILTADATNFLAHGSGGPWSTPKGQGLKAGFIDGCRRGTPEPTCKCMFDYISSQAPYDTPDGFITLSYGVNSYLRTGDSSRIAPVFMAAGRHCRA
jgi:hypothetical protein